MIPALLGDNDASLFEDDYMQTVVHGPYISPLLKHM